MRHAEDYARHHGYFTFTSVTVHEVVFGLEAKRATSQLQKALRWLKQNEEITPAAEDYLLAATMKASARRTGVVLELADCLIASVAVRLELPLVTGNTGHFRAIQATGVALRIESWRAR